MRTTTQPPRQRRVVARALGLGLSALAAAALVTWTPAATSGWNQGAAEATLWQLMNGARMNNGMAPVQQHGTLVGLARWRSDDMLARNYFSHTIPGCGCLVYTYYDSNGLNYVWGGENIGWNSGLDDSYSAVAVHEQFMGSPGHRSNVLNAAFTHGGVGAAARDNTMFQGHVQNTRMFTELFMQAPSAPAPAPAPQPAAQAPAPAPAPASAPRPGTATAPQPAGRAAAPITSAEAAPEPKPKVVRVDAPRRPVSAAGLDGVATLVSGPVTERIPSHLRADEIAAERLAGFASDDKATAALTRGEMRVAPAEPAPAGVLDGIVSAVLGFLFG